MHLDSRSQFSEPLKLTPTLNVSRSLIFVLIIILSAGACAIALALQDDSTGDRFHGDLTKVPTGYSSQLATTCKRERRSASPLRTPPKQSGVAAVAQNARNVQSGYPVEDSQRS